MTDPLDAFIEEAEPAKPVSSQIVKKVKPKKRLFPGLASGGNAGKPVKEDPTPQPARPEEVKPEPIKSMAPSFTEQIIQNSPATGEKPSSPSAERRQPTGPPISGLPQPENGTATVAYRSSQPALPEARNMVPSGVPSSLEKYLSGGEEARSSAEVLGILIDAHIKEAEAILGRTYLNDVDVNTISDAFMIAKHGIGGEVPELNQPIIEISEWALTKLRALPSVGGRSRSDFVDSYTSSEARRERERKAQEEERQRNAFRTRD